MRTQASTLRCSMPPVRSAQVFAARNLHLLSAIENTLDALTSDTNLISVIGYSYDEIHEMLMAVAQELSKEELGLCLSPVEQAGNTVGRLWRDAQKRHKAACDDPRLLPDDGVIEAWQQFMEALYSLHEKIEEIRNWLEDVIACLEPRGDRVFTDADDMVASIMSGK